MGPADTARQLWVTAFDHSFFKTQNPPNATQAIGGLIVCKQQGEGTKSLVKIFGKGELDGTPEDTKGAKEKR